MATRWDPDQYLRYGDERQRPFEELVSRIPHRSPIRVVDLGCGPGTTTAGLLERWPEARISGIDSSPEMIDKAAPLARPGRLEFTVGDLRDWNADGTEDPVDVVMCCATLQWVPGHVELLPRIIGSLAPGGVFAFQVPGNFDQPSHTLLYELARSDRWSALLGDLVRPDPVLSPERYLRVLLDLGTTADVWSTTYLHVLEGADAVLEWVRGTALRPYLSALEAEGEDTAEAFLSAYSAALRAAYPTDPAGRTVFPFRRIFAVAEPLSQENAGG